MDSKLLANGMHGGRVVLDRHTPSGTFIVHFRRSNQLLSRHFAPGCVLPNRHRAFNGILWLRRLSTKPYALRPTAGALPSQFRLRYTTDDVASGGHGPCSAGQTRIQSIPEEQQSEDLRQGSTRGSDEEGPSTSGRLPDRTIAAMALAPVASLALPLVQNQNWQESFQDFKEELRRRVYFGVNSERFQEWLAWVDENIMYMDWTWDWCGIDFSYVWDPEMWFRFKQAVFQDEPAIFWNKLWDRIEYRSLIPQAGIVGDMRISFSKFLQLLEANNIKRIIVYGDMKTAIVEVPHPWYASLNGAPGIYPFRQGPDGAPLQMLVPNPDALNDPMQWYCPEMPEWNMEKYRFYLDLPGDFWENGQLLSYLKSRMVKIYWDVQAKEYVVPSKYITKVNEVRTELQVLDPSESWDFLAWLTHEEKLEFYEKCAAVCLFIRGLAISINLLTSTKLFQLWRKKTKKVSKQESMWQRLTSHKAREFMTKDAKTGKLKDTGVRFSDIAGMDHIVFEMREIVKMLLRDPAYVKVGAKAPRGVIFQGPPGTGKTYLARAIAGEAGVTFLSAVGSEFVEMFAGVAAARVNSLYYEARKKAPCIIFIDEIDAIGRARSTLGADPGSMERESALLSMLVQMDGIHGNLEQVLTIGATNLASELDQALLRPGRFEVVYEIPSPGPIARLEILKYHSRNKPLEHPSTLTKVAEVTHGWSAASLANLMNEAAILTVRRNVEKITLPMIMDLIDNQSWGEATGKIPPSEAKNRLALVTAAKAVAFALTPGLDPIRHVTLWSKKRGLGPVVDFIPSEENLDVNWHPEEVEIMDYKTNFKVNAAPVGDEKLGEFFHVASMMIPLYAPRACELVMFGRDDCSLATAAPISDCFELAYYCVRNSLNNPRFRSLPPLHTYIWLGNDSKLRDQRDPLALGLDEELGYHKMTLTMLKAAWRRALKLVTERRTTIVKVAEALLQNEDETITGSHLVHLVENTPLDDASDIVIEKDFLPLVKAVLGNVPGVILEGSKAVDEEGRQMEVTSGPGKVGTAAFLTQAPDRTVGEVAFSSSAGTLPPIVLDDATLADVSRAIMGRLDMVDLVGRNTAEELAERVRDSLLHPETVERIKAIRRYVEDVNSPFPPAPLDSEVPRPIYGQIQMDLEWWKQRKINSITWSAIDMLYSERQLKYYRQDMDVPKLEDTSAYKEKESKSQAPKGTT